MVSCSSDTMLKVWDLNNGCVMKTFAKHEDYVKALVFSSYSKTLVSGGLDSKIFIWDIEHLNSFDKKFENFTYNIISFTKNNLFLAQIILCYLQELHNLWILIKDLFIV